MNHSEEMEREDIIMYMPFYKVSPFPWHPQSRRGSRYRVRPHRQPQRGGAPAGLSGPPAWTGTQWQTSCDTTG